MNNDDIKKFIDHSKLYTEVDLEKNQKVEEGFVDWVKEKLGITDADNNKALADLTKKLDPATKKKIDDIADEETGKKDQGNAKGGAIQGKVEVRPTSQGGRNKLQDRWDKKYAATHNPDGTPKTDIAQSSAAEYKSIADAQADKSIKKGDVVVIGGEKVTADATEQGQVFFIDANGEPFQQRTNTDDGSIDAVGSEEDPEVTDQEGGVAQGMDQADAATDTPASTGGSLLGRKLDTANPNLMKAYNDGGKKAMPEIRNLQTALARLGFDPNGLDGKYGNGTFTAVQEFQKANGLDVDGQAGPETMKALKNKLDADFEKNKVSPGDDVAGKNDGKEVPSTTDDAMTAKNQDIDIKTAQPNADLDRYIELLNKLEGGEKQAGAPNAELDAQQRGVAVAETDLRKLISIVEATLLAEQLTDAEMAELEALHTKIQGYVGMPGMDDQKIEDALNRYLKVKGATSTPNASTAADAGKAVAADAGTDVDKTKSADAPTVTLDTISAQIKKGITFDQLQKAVTDAEALEPEDAAKDANILKKLGAKAKQLVSTKDYRVKYVLAKGAETLGIDGLYHTNGKLFYFMKDGQPSAAAGGSMNSAMQVAQLGLLPPKKVADFQKKAPNNPKFQALLDAHAKATGEGGAEAVANANVSPSKELNLTATGTNNFNINRSQPFVDIMDGGKKTRVYGDPKLLQKRYPDQKVNQPTKESTTKDTTMKKAIKEASMNISINGDSAAEVAELANILKNAGMDTHSHSNDMLPKADEMPAMAMDPHDDMVSKMSMMDEPAPDDSGCGMEEETVDESEWDNSPEEAYADHQTMTHDLSGGINRRKPKGAERAKDPAVALETSIRERLWAALNEKVTEGKKKKKNRGAMEDVNVKERGDADKKKKKNRGTMEGSKGKTSRGEKKSKG